MASRLKEPLSSEMERAEDLLGPSSEGAERLPNLQEDIRRTRDDLAKGGTILFSHILIPIAEHGSHLIFAPDEVVWKAGKLAWKYTSAAWRRCSSDAPGQCVRICGRQAVGRYCRLIFTPSLRKCVILGLLLPALFVFAVHGQAVKCWLQDIFLGWAHFNRRIGMIERFFSISALMVVRLLVSNILPFTSPVFAYLIAKSQPEGQEWAGTMYLLACSMPAGFLMPTLDMLAWLAFRREFLATRCASLLTDFLPFSFWVRIFFMEPAFQAAQATGAQDASAAAAAVLAGHFMIWAGPATTMYQRNFVPDWITCTLIQPLGLMEDVAIILATWAGASAASQKNAQITLYGFMLAMNLLTLLTAEPPRLQRWVRHLWVGVMTVGLAYYTYQEPVVELMTTTTTTLTPPLCETEHSDVHAIIHTVMVVSIEAFVLSLGGKFFEHIASWIAGRSTMSR